MEIAPLPPPYCPSSALSIKFFFPKKIQPAMSNEPNPVSQPQVGAVLTAGTSFNIVWTPTIGDLISIELWTKGLNVSINAYFSGNNCLIPNMACSMIAQNIANSGSFLWGIPANAPLLDDYFIDLYVPDPPPGEVYFYETGDFSIAKAGIACHIILLMRSIFCRFK